MHFGGTWSFEHVFLIPQSTPISEVGIFIYPLAFKVHDS